MIYNETLNVSFSDYKCGFCTLYVVLFVVFLITVVIIRSAFIYFHWCLKKYIAQWYLKENDVCIKFGPGTQTTIY